MDLACEFALDTGGRYGIVHCGGAEEISGDVSGEDVGEADRDLPESVGTAR